MSHTQKGKEMTSSESTILTNLASLAVSGTGEFIRKTGQLTFENAVPAGGTGSGVTSFNGRDGVVLPVTNDYLWSMIDKTVSNIADLTDRSHTSLTGIGTNSHVDIDNHIANTSNPHSVTASQVGAIPLSHLDTDVSLTANSDVKVPSQKAIKTYVDTLTSLGSRLRQAVRVATKSAGTLATDFENGDTVDGVVLATGNRILIKNQATASENGVYTVNASGAPTRATDSDTAGEMLLGYAYPVTLGSDNANTLWYQYTPDVVTLGTDSINYALLQTVSAYTAGDGLSLTAFDFDVDIVANDGLEFSGGQLTVSYDNSSIGIVSNNLSVLESGITGAMIQNNAVSLTTKVSGILPVANGGTNITTYTTGDILYASGTTTLSKLADVATGNALISGGVATAPSWGKIGLTTHVSGTLPIANGGTNITTYTTGDILYASANDVLSKLTYVGTATRYLGNSTGSIAWEQINLTNGVTGNLPASNLPDGLSYGGMLPLTGVTYPRVFGSNLPTGNNDLYTVPTGRRALILNTAKYYNSSAGTIPVFTQLKYGGAYYRLGGTTSTAAGTGSTGGGPTQDIVLEAGDILSVNTTTTSGLNITFAVIEFDSTSPLYSPRSLALSSGNNTIYTVPSGKTAIGYRNGFSSNNFIARVNDSGGALNYIHYNVPSGGSPNSTNQISASASSSSAFSDTIGGSLEAGDFIVVNTSGGGAGQIAWMTVYEQTT